MSSSLTRRIVLLNVAGLVAMLLGFLWLTQTRESVIDARVQSLSTQAEIIAAAIAGQASVKTDSIRLDPDRLLSLQAGEGIELSKDDLNSIEFSLNPERVAPVLKRLVTPTRTRARVFDQEGSLLLDTRSFYSPGDISRMNQPAAEDSSTLFERSWNTFKRRFNNTSIPSDDSSAGGKFPEVARALAGVATSLVRVSTEGQTIVYVSVPIQRLRAVPGALLLSTQEGDIDRIIAAERFSIFIVFLIAAGVMMILSFLLAGTIAEPVRRLADAAERVRRGTRTRQEIPDFTTRSDEIGHLSGALRDMTTALYNRIEAIESFAADVAHELKNPLTSLRSAVETMPLAKSEESKKRLLDVIGHDVRRLDRLISDISDASRLDADLQRHDTTPVDMGSLLQTLVGVANDTPRDCAVRIVFEPEPDFTRDPRRYFIAGHDSRLSQVVSNLIDNAVSFSPTDAVVRVGMARIDDEIEIVVEDQGPGVPDHALERVFERFYTDRPEHRFGQNSGLGLSISRQIVESHRGRIWAENRADSDEGEGVTGEGVTGEGITGEGITGARFVVRLPALNKD
ncbi:MAG: sensor histidine kinase [Beijerinckiaceae bacterium]|nr:sensor histidine kinase [Beijerinckiaceae bacterium]